MRVTVFLLAFAAGGLVSVSANAQRIPFFDAAGTGFDPEISVVNSGELLDAQAVVSNDLKYVTINARASSSRLLALREFAFANRDRNAIPQLGFVGGAAAALEPDGQGGRRRVPRAGIGGDAPRNALDRPGMTLVGRL